MRTMLRLSAAVTALPAVLAAQLLTIPNGTAATEGNSSNAFPWGRGNGGLLIQCVYDGANFTAQGITGPILITGLRWRLDASAPRTFAGGNYAQATVRLSTCPLDYAALDSTFSSNRGSDLQTVRSGPITLLAGTSAPPGPGPNLVSFQWAPPFYYRPASGDLLIEVELPPTGYTGLGTHVDVQTTGSRSSRVYASTNYGAPAGTVEVDHGPVVQLGYTMVTGLAASFLADRTSGTTPLAVQFTDQSHSTAPGGITSWAWDFDNDGVIDSTLQHPQHVYTQCGVHSVALTVADGSNPPATFVRSDFVATDATVPGFTWALVGLGGTVQFTDTSAPPATAWAWDLDGDQVVDSTLQNPQWSYGSACGSPHQVTLTVHRLCRGPFTTAQSVFVAARLETLRTGTTVLGGGCYADLVVANPQGVSVCRLEAKTTAASGAPVTFDVFLTPGGYAGATGNAARWRLLGSASGVGAAGAEELDVATFAPPLYLPAGSYGLHVRTVGASPVGSALTGPQAFATADLSLQLGAAGVLGAAATGNRAWNGVLHYTTSATNGDPGFAFFGPGCAGTLGIPTLTAGGLPRLGLAASVSIDRLPLSGAFVLMGFGNQSSTLGPLPLDLTPYQMPGCALRVANDGAVFLLGANNTATWSLTIPGQVALLGLRYYLQALAPSPGSNGRGAVVSDAAVSIVGV